MEEYIKTFNTHAEYQTYINSLDALLPNLSFCEEKNGHLHYNRLPRDIIMTKKTNTPVLAICYAQGWCENENYMTATEAAAVTNIGSAFKGITNITHFEEFQYFTGLNEIPSEAFRGSKLLNIVLPPNITSIGQGAFYSCNLSQCAMLVIPEGVTTIGGSAFRSINVPAISIPSTVTSIDSSQYCYVFSSTSIKTINWNSQLNPNGHNYWAPASGVTKFTSDVYTVIDDCLYADNGSTLFAAPPNKTNVVIPNTVTTIASNACRSNVTKSIILPDSLQVIGAYSFAYVNFETHLVIPEGVTSIGQEAFRYGTYRLVYVPSTCATLGGSAFSNAPNGVTNRVVVFNRNTKPSSSSKYTFTCNEPKWKVYVPVGATSNYPINSAPFSTSYVQSVSELPSTFDSSSRQAIINSLDALDAL